MDMILLVTPSARVQECSKALQEATSETVQVAPSLRQAITHLRAQEYLAVVLDQSLVESEPDETDSVLQHMGTATPVFMNFAISNLDRVVRELRSALHRRKRESVVVQQAAQEALRNELKGTVTALLLSCEMALQASESPTAEARLRKVYELALEIRAKLGVGEEDRALKAAH